MLRSVVIGHVPVLLEDGRVCYQSRVRRREWRGARVAGRGQLSRCTEFPLFM